MNIREGYITTKISQEKGRRGPEKGRRPLCDREGLAHPCPRTWGPFSLGRWAARFCVFFTPKTSHRLIRVQLLDPFSTNSL